MPKQPACLENRAPVFETGGDSAVQNFWIIGGGKFGLRAAVVLRKADSANSLKIVEKRTVVCRQLHRMDFETVCTDGIGYLERHLTGLHYPDWIIPAIPVHVAYEWIRAKLSAGKELLRISVPAGLISKLPNPTQGKAGQFYTSIADFKCPGNCPEPAGICTHTGKSRPMILHEFLKSIRYNDFKSIVIRSHQLAPGVGGYQPEDLFNALQQIETIKKPVLFSTACSCHGVMEAFKLSAT